MARKPLKIVFFGTAEFAVPSLAALREAGHEILAVVTQPDKPQGRGMKLTASPVKLVAEVEGLTVLQPRRVRSESFVTDMRERMPDLLVVAAFGQVIPQSLLDLPPLGPINVHGSLLPQYRGAAPIQRALMAGEAELGVTTMWMDATLDTGDMLLKGSISVEEDDNAGTLIPRLAALGARLLIQTIEGLVEGNLRRVPQDNAAATFAPAVLLEDGMLRWSENAAVIHNRVRGVSPKPGAFTSVREKRLKVWKTSIGSSTDLLADAGTVLAIAKNPAGVLVACGEGSALLLQEVQPESGKRMSAADWARGIRLGPGDRFSSP